MKKGDKVLTDVCYSIGKIVRVNTYKGTVDVKFPGGKGTWELNIDEVREVK